MNSSLYLWSILLCEQYTLSVRSPLLNPPLTVGEKARVKDATASKRQNFVLSFFVLRGGVSEYREFKEFKEYRDCFSNLLGLLGLLGLLNLVEAICPIGPICPIGISIISLISLNSLTSLIFNARVKNLSLV